MIAPGFNNEPLQYSSELENIIHKTIKKVSEDIEEMKFNTAISTLMTLVNEFYKTKKVNKAELKTFLELLNPFAPHITEEIYEKIGAEKEISKMPWPIYDDDKTIDSKIEIPIQINGKLKATVEINLDSSEDTVKNLVHDKIKDILKDKDVIKEIYVKNKIYNIVIK